MQGSACSASCACLRRRSFATSPAGGPGAGRDTLLLLFGLFILIEGIRCWGHRCRPAVLPTPSPAMTLPALYPAGIRLGGPFCLHRQYPLCIDTMLPVVQGIAELMNGGAGFPPELFYFGLLTGATLGGNLTPIGALANSQPSASCASR